MSLFCKMLLVHNKVTRFYPHPAFRCFIELPSVLIGCVKKWMHTTWAVNTLPGWNFNLFAVFFLRMLLVFFDQNISMMVHKDKEILPRKLPNYFSQNTRNIKMSVEENHPNFFLFIRPICIALSAYMQNVSSLASRDRTSWDVSGTDKIIVSETISKLFSRNVDANRPEIWKESRKANGLKKKDDIVELAWYIAA